MKPLTILAIVLIALGVIAFGFQGFTYISRDTVVDAGPLQVTADREHRVPFAPIVGAVALIAGIAIFVVASRKSSV